MNNFVLEFKCYGEPDAMIKSGYVDTTMGIIMTRSDVFDVLKTLELDILGSAREKERLADFQRSEILAEKERKRAHFDRLQIAKAFDRQTRHGGTFSLPRTFKRWRLAVKKLLARKQADQICREFVRQGRGGG